MIAVRYKTGQTDRQIWTNIHQSVALPFPAWMRPKQMEPERQNTNIKLSASGVYAIKKIGTMFAS